MSIERVSFLFDSLPDVSEFFLISLLSFLRSLLDDGPFSELYLLVDSFFSLVCFLSLSFLDLSRLLDLSAGSFLVLSGGSLSARSYRTSPVMTLAFLTCDSFVDSLSLTVIPEVLVIFSTFSLCPA
uniref:Uncharacterized protein n=1 Tax=Cacopsylla melanoneura TaxID=428564 RepID=A0A8D8S103_9HEMI